MEGEGEGAWKGRVAAETANAPPPPANGKLVRDRRGVLVAIAIA